MAYSLSSERYLPMNWPLEIVDHVFNFLPFSALGVAARVCKTWRDLSQEERRWRELCAERNWQKIPGLNTWLETAKHHVEGKKLFASSKIIESVPAEGFYSAEDSSLMSMLTEKFAVMAEACECDRIQFIIKTPKTKISICRNRTEYSWISIDYLDKNQTNISFIAQGIFYPSCAEMEGNTFAFYAHSEDEKRHALVLLDVRKQMLNCYEDFASDKVYSEVKLAWIGATLFAYLVSANEKSVRLWDFSKSATDNEITKPISVSMLQRECTLFPPRSKKMAKLFRCIMM